MNRIIKCSHFDWLLLTVRHTSAYESYIRYCTNFWLHYTMDLYDFCLILTVACIMIVCIQLLCEMFNYFPLWLPLYHNNHPMLHYSPQHIKTKFSHKNSTHFHLIMNLSHSTFFFCLCDIRTILCNDIEILCTKTHYGMLN